MRVGEPLPAFVLPDPATGTPFDSASLAGNDAMVLFLRGTWCPYCRQQLAVLAERFPVLEAAGIKVLAISCQSAASIRKFTDSTPLPFPLLADDKRQVAKAFGVHYRWRWDGFDLAHPSLFITDRSGTTTFAHVGKSMSDLPIGMILDRFTAMLSETRTETTQ